MSPDEELAHLRARCAELESLIDDDPCTPLQRAIMDGLGFTQGEAAILSALAVAHPRPLTGPRLAGLYEAYVVRHRLNREIRNPLASVRTMICRIRERRGRWIVKGGRLADALEPYSLSDAMASTIAVAAGDAAPANLKRLLGAGRTA